VERLDSFDELFEGNFSIKLSRLFFKAAEEGKVQLDPEVLGELNKLAIKLQFLQKHVVKPESGNCTLNDKLIVLLSMDNKVSGSIFSVRICFKISINSGFRSSIS
jgi:hypothetical protein